MNTYEIGFRLSLADAIRKETFTAYEYPKAHQAFRLKYPTADFLWSIRVGIPTTPDRRLPREDD